MKSSILSTSQPPSLVEAIKAAAKRDGVPVSQWVGAACLRALKPKDAAKIQPRSKVGRPTK